MLSMPSETNGPILPNFQAARGRAKLGEGHDVSGVELDDLAIDIYGEVIKILSRPKTID
jgi:hypothetical protein